MKPNQHEIGVGATAELSLRVSVAALVSVLFVDPEAGSVNETHEHQVRADSSS